VHHVEFPINALEARVHLTAQLLDLSCDVVKALLDLGVYFPEPTIDLLKASVNLLEAFIDLLEASVDLLEAFIDLLEASVDLLEAFIYLLKASVNLLELLVDVLEPLVDMPEAVVHSPLEDADSIAAAALPHCHRLHGCRS
jgi:hypothetical protein